jgi:hypothetical protein
MREEGEVQGRRIRVGEGKQGIEEGRVSWKRELQAFASTRRRLVQNWEEQLWEQSCLRMGATFWKALEGDF